MKNSRSFKSLSRTSLINSPSSRTATTQVSKGVQYPPVSDEMYKTFSTKNINKIVINYDEFENCETSSDISTKPIRSRQASAKTMNKLKSKETLLNNKNKFKLQNNSPFHNKRILSAKTSRNYLHHKPIIQCTKECKQNILKNFSNYKYINLSTLDRLTSDKLEIGFLKHNKPLIPVQNISSLKLKSLETASRTKNLLSPINKTTDKNPNKIFFANINKTKQNKFMNLISKLTLNHNESNESTSKENKSRNENTKRKGSVEHNQKEYLSLKHFSIMNKFILKLVDPDEMVEDYMLEGNKPFDRFTKFKKVCVREKTRVCGLVSDLHKAPFVNKEQIKVYLSKIKKLKK